MCIRDRALAVFYLLCCYCILLVAAVWGRVILLSLIHIYSGFVRDVNYVPNVYRLGVRYHDLKWNADLTMRAGSGADHASFVDSSYLTMDMAVTYKADANWSIFAKGYNLTNEAYADCGGVDKGSYNYPAQARRFMVGAEYSF